MAKKPGALRLLVVENDELLREVVEGMLVVFGHDIVGRAGTAVAAVAEAERKLPDAVLMDVRLDGVGDGIDAAFAIRNRLGIRSFFLTGTTDSATRQRAALADPIGYLEKPVRLRDLETALARVRGDAPSPASYFVPPIDLMRVPTLVSLGINPLDWKSSPMAADMSAKEKRKVAARARRLAQGLSLDSDRERLLHYADELDLQAEAMEQQEIHQSPAPSAIYAPGEHQQQQQQQEGETSTSNGDHCESPK